MDAKVIAALIVLTGIFATALFAVVGYFYKVDLEKKKSARSLLYILMELRYSLITSLFNPDDACVQYVKHCTKKLHDMGIPVSESDMDAQLRELLINFFSNMIDTVEVDIKNRLLEPFELALTELATINPILAYQIKGKENLQKLLAHNETHIQNVNQEITPHLTQAWAKESMLKHSSHIKNEVINKVCENLESEVLLVAKDCSRKDLRNCKAIMNKGLNNKNKYDFSEIDELLTPAFEKIIEDGKCNMSKTQSSA